MKVNMRVAGNRACRRVFQPAGPASQSRPEVSTQRSEAAR
jgi:hypothetical protein